MIHLELDNQEKEVLTETLESYLSDMSYEIADTDRMAFREQLKARRNTLKKVLEAVKEAT